MENKKGISPTGIKLLGAIGALCAAAVLLVTSTLAWFTVSNAPEVRKVNLNIQTVRNFEIARAVNGKGTQPSEVSSNDMAVNDKDNTWGQTVTFEEGSEINISIPSTIADGELQTVQFDEESGRTNGLIAVDTSDPQDIQEGVGYFKVDDKNCAAVYGIWMRTNTTGEITAEIGEITIESGDRELREKPVGVAIRMGEGEIIPVVSDQTVTLGTLQASKEGTYSEIIVYLEGDTSEDDKGVVAYDVGGDNPITITIDKILFKNSNVEASE